MISLLPLLMLWLILVYCLVNAGKPDLNKLLTTSYHKRDFKKKKAFRKNELVKRGC